jgi:hypothetical protein
MTVNVATRVVVVALIVLTPVALYMVVSFFCTYSLPPVVRPAVYDEQGPIEENRGATSTATIVIEGRSLQGGDRWMELFQIVNPSGVGEYWELPSYMDFRVRTTANVAGNIKYRFEKYEDGEVNRVQVWSE